MIAKRTTAPMAVVPIPAPSLRRMSSPPGRERPAGPLLTGDPSSAADDDVRARDARRADAAEREGLGRAGTGRQRRRLLAERRVRRARPGQGHSDRLATAIRGGLVQAV